RSRSSRVMLVADSVDFTSTMLTMRVPSTWISSSVIAPTVTSALVAAPRETVTSASLPSTAPLLVALTWYLPTGRWGNRELPSASAFTVGVNPVSGLTTVTSASASGLLLASTSLPTSEPSPLAACAMFAGSAAASDIPIAMYIALLRMLLFMSSPGPVIECQLASTCADVLWSADACLERVVPLVEIEIAAAPFDLPALQVDGFGTEMLLRRRERLAVVVVEGDTIRIEAAEIEQVELRIAGVELAERYVHRHPAVGREIEPAPVVQVVVVAVGENHSGLPARRNAVETEQRHQQQGLLAAVGVARVEC